MILVTMKIPEGLKKAIQEAAKKRFMSMSGYFKYAAQRQLNEDGFNWTEEKAKPVKKK